jgi:hypothetical protein
MNARGNSEELPPVRGSYVGAGNPSSAEAVAPDRQSAAPDTLAFIRSGRPDNNIILAFLERLHPEIRANGLDIHQALWVAVDARGGLRKSWVGPNLDFNFQDGFRPAPWLSLPAGPERSRGYAAYVEAQNLELQRNVPDL